MGCQAGVEAAKLTTVMNDKKTESTKSYDTIKLGIDAHSKWYYVARQLDGATPQPVQKMEIDGLLHFVAKQQNLADEVHTCYEAGPSDIICTANLRRWESTTSWCSRRTGTNGARE